MKKEHDYILELISNPTFNSKDFLLVGLNSDNTGLEDKSVYEKSKLITSNPIFQKEDGEFNKELFDTFYNQALQLYNDLVLLTENPIFFRDDIFAPKTLKGSEKPEFTIEKVRNPLRLQKGFGQFGISEEPSKSVREIAEGNPTYDYKTGLWLEDVESMHWWENFTDPKVLALWDYDADENGNPTNDKDKIYYKKGSKKINPVTGTYYWETLGNRDIYGREVLSGFDTLTKEGTTLNKYDFFDSDDILKSTAGSLARAAAQIVPVFIPYVNTAYIATRIGLSLSEILPTIGKVFTGNDSPVLSKLEAFNKATTFSTSDYTQGSAEAGIESNPWTMETGLKLIADVFTQLAELRWIFKYGQAMFAGVNPKILGETAEALKARLAYLEAKALKGPIDLKDFAFKNPTELELKIASLKTLNFESARANLELSLKRGQELSKHLSMAYMTGVTTASAYGEAKLLGASDMEAALFTLGYTAGEYLLLNSDIGQWILPELKIETMHTKNVARNLGKITREYQEEAATPEGQKKLFQKLFDYGKLFFTQNFSDDIVKSTTKMTMSSALAEGVEETSEEALLDFSKTVFNLVNDARGDDTHFDDAWENMESRYGMSFIGGTVGGTLATGLEGFREAKQWKDPKADSLAYYEAVYMLRNGKKKLLEKAIMANDYASRTLSTEMVENEDGTTSYKPAKSYKESLDYAVKQELVKQLDIIDSILNSEGAAISDGKLLNDLLLRKELKFNTLLGSNVLGVYTNEFHNTISELTDVSNEINNLEALKKGKDSDATDAQNRERIFTEEQKTRLEKLKKRQKELRDILEAYKNGSKANEFIAEGLFEMDLLVASSYAPIVYFPEFAEEESGKKYSELTSQELDILRTKYNNTNKRDIIHRAYQVFKKNQQSLADTLAKYEKDYFTKNDLLHELENLFGSNIPLVVQSNNLAKDAENLLGGAIYSDIIYGIIKNGAENWKDRFDEIYIPFVKSLGLEALPKTIEEFLNLTPEQQDNILLNLSASGLMEGEPTTDAELTSLLTKLEESYDVNKLLDYEAALNSFLLDPNVVNILELQISKAKYITPTTKLYLRDFINLSGLSPANKETIIAKINSLASSPIEELLLSMIQTLQGNGIDTTGMVADLASQLSDLIKASNAENFGYSPEIEKKINDTFLLLNLAESHIEAAKTEIVGDFNNVYGYNATLNELVKKYPVEGWIPLAQLNSNTANALLLDLANLRNELEFYKAIFVSNSNALLTDHIKTDLKLNTIYYKTLKNWSVEIPDGWNGKKEIDEAINNATLTESVLDKDSITDELRATLLKERLAMEQAVHNFFKKNKGKNLKDLFRTFNFIVGKHSILNSATTTEDVLDFIWRLASLAAADPTAVMNEYRKIITGEKYAPVIALEEAIRRAYTYLLNPKVFEEFALAYNELVKEHYDALGQNVDKDEYIMSPRHFLIEGIAGSGKTTAVYTHLRKLINDNHPELLLKIWFISNSTLNAEKAASEIGLPNVTAMSKEEYLNRIALGYHGFNEKSKIDPEDLILDERGIYHYKGITLNEGIEAPTLVLFDEISSFSQQDLLLSDDFLRAKDIYALAAGDFDQMGASGSFKVKVDGLEEPNTVEVRLTNSNFISSWKLGTAIRADNIHKEKNQSVLRATDIRNLFKDLLSDHPIKPILLAYYQNLTGLFGDKVSTDLSDFELTVTLMLQTLKKDEQIHVISDNKESDFYKILERLSETDEFKGKIDLIKDAATSLGLEGQYYIVDLSLLFNDAKAVADEEAHSNFGKALYTTLTRAKQGTLIIGNYDDDLFESIAQLSSKQKALSEEIISDFAKRRRKQIDSAITGDPRTSLGQEITVPETTTNPSDSNDGDDITREQVLQSNKEKEPVLTNEKEEELWVMLHSFMLFETGCESDKDPTDPTAHLKLGRYYKKRIDNLNGLAQIAQRSRSLITIPGIEVDSDGNITKGLEKLLQLLGELKGVIAYTEDKADIIRSIQELLRTDIPLKIDFIYKNQVRDFEDETKTINWFDLVKHQIYQIYYKGKNEFLAAIFNKKNAGQEIRRPADLTISAIITLADGTKLVEIPVAKIMSPLTLLANYPEFEAIKLLYEDEGKDVSKFKARVRLELKNGSTIPHLKAFAMLLELYTDSSNTAVYLTRHNESEPEFTIAKNAKPTGILTTADMRGLDYDHTLSYLYEGEWMDLDEYRKRMPWRKISKVYISTQRNGAKVVSINGHEIKVGDYFVLTSDYYAPDTPDKVLFEEYIKQLLNPNSKPLIRLVYVMPPVSTFEDYIFNLHNALVKNTDYEVDRSLGNKMTAFRILLNILVDGSKFNQAIDRWLLTSNNKEQATSRVKTIRELVKWLTNYNPPSGKTLYDLLNTPLRSLGSEFNKSLLSYKYPGTDGEVTAWILDVNSDLTLRHILQRELHSLLFSEKLWYGDRALDKNLLKKTDRGIELPDFVKDRFLALKNDLTTHGWQGILYHLIPKANSEIRFDNNGLILTFAELDTNIGEDYSVSGHPILINGKLDSTGYTMNVLPWLDWIIRGIGHNPDRVSTRTEYTDSEGKVHKYTGIFDLFEEDEEGHEYKTLNYLWYNGKLKEPKKPSVTSPIKDLTNSIENITPTDKGKITKQFNKLSEEELKRVLADPREFIFQTTGKIVNYLNGKLTLFNFDNIEDILILDKNTILFKADKKVYKLENSNEAEEVGKDYLEGLTVKTATVQKWISEFPEALDEEVLTTELLPILNKISKSFQTLPIETIITNVEMFMSKPENFLGDKITNILLTLDPNNGRYSFNDLNNGPTALVLMLTLGKATGYKLANLPENLAPILPNVEELVEKLLTELPTESCNFTIKSIKWIVN